MPLDSLKPYSRRYVDYAIQYDLDFIDKISIVSQRFYQDDNNINTPLVSCVLNRKIESNYPIPQNRAITKRAVKVCFFNSNNVSGVTEYSVAIPYRPTNPNHNDCVRELLYYENVITGSYSGETHLKDIRIWL